MFSSKLVLHRMLVGSRAYMSGCNLVIHQQFIVMTHENFLQVHVRVHVTNMCLDQMLCLTNFIFGALFTKIGVG